MTKKIILVLFFFLILSPNVFAQGTNTYYVSTSGSDSNPGTIGSPFRTIQKGVNTVAAGGTLYVRGGTYNEQVSISRTGTASQPITISGYPNERPIIDGQRTLPGNEWSSLVSLSGSNIVFNNFEVRYSGGIGISITGNYNLIKNCSSHHSYNNGILISGSGSYNTVEDSEVWYNCTDNENGLAGHWAIGMAALRYPNHSTFRRNKVYNNWGEGLSGSGEYVVMEDNVVYDNYAVNIYFGNSPNVLIQRNLIYYTGDSRFSKAPGIAYCDEEAGEATHDVQIVNNLILGGNRAFYHFKQTGTAGLRNWLIAYNTFVNSNREVLFQIASGGHSNSRIENNIFVQEDSLPIAIVPSDTNLIFSNNLWSKTPPSNVSGSGDIIGNPQLSKTDAVSAGQLSPNWFKILSASSARDHALRLAEVTEDYFRASRGTSPDIGAHEYTGTASTPTPTPTPTPTSHRRIIFLHHSTGSNVYYTGNVSSELANRDGTMNLQITERSYPNTPYPWNNYPYDYWNLWLNGACNSSNPSIECMNTLTQNYDVIIFKHCFPGSDVLADTGSPSISSSRKSLENYKLQYRALRNLMDQYPNKIFIIWTLAPLHRNATTAGNAARAREFANWVKGQFLTENGSHPNIYVWDFFNLMAGSDNFLKYEYERDHSGTDSHPNTAGNQYAGPLFAQFIVDSIKNFEGNITPTPTPTVILCARKGEGDANCDGVINILDFETWRREFLGIDTTTKSDFDSSGGVTILDFEIWRRGFLGQ